MWKSPACLSANDSVRLTEIRDCDCAETIPLGALSREWSPFKGKRCGTCIWHNYEGTPITSTSKRSKDPASLSLIARDVEIHLINDPRARLFLRSGKPRFTNLFHTFWKHFFSSILSPCTLPPRPYLLSRRTPYPLMASCHTCLPIRNICPRLC